MATLRFILGLICLVSTVGHRLPHRDLLKAQRRVIGIAETQVGVREIGGTNRGPQVKAYLAYVNLKEGYPWCAAFISWVYGQAGYHSPQTPWSPALFPQGKLTLKPTPASVYGLYSPQLKRVYHCGLITGLKNDWIIGIEGNTNGAGSTEGDGVYRKWRHRKTISICQLVSTERRSS